MVLSNMLKYFEGDKKAINFMKCPLVTTAETYLKEKNKSNIFLVLYEIIKQRF